MMLVAVVSVKGSPGVTTFSVALATRWPGPGRPLLVESDPSGGDLAVRFSLAASPGLVSFLAAARQSSDPGLLWQHAQSLADGLPVVTAPPDADRARAVLSALFEPITGGGMVRAAANARNTAVIVDCGRIEAGSAALPAVQSADALIVLTGARADDLAHLARRLPTLGRWTPCPVLMLVGDGYSREEVGRELGVTPLGRIPHDPRGAAMFCGRTWWRRAGRSALGEVARKVATTLLAQNVPFPLQGPAESQPMPPGRTVPDVPTGPASARGLRVVPLSQFEPGGPSSWSGGNAL
ncbi:chromosome partitioning protein [Amycolatopsis pigmentata]|uniref:Chromosome partitioning protein n=1 Tax=Amycolatopsis pigmentata TaxID=450801 RepID=A0ABW5FM52_9PSEU